MDAQQENDQVTEKLGEMTLKGSPERFCPKTGYVTSRKMLQYHNLWNPNSIECPDRLSACIDHCERLGLFERCIKLEESYATESHVLLQHSRDWLDQLKATPDYNYEQLLEFSRRFSSIFVHQNTFQTALLSLGCCIELIENVLQDKVQNGLALVRPPGHHANKSKPNGFCFFNNVAICAKLAIEKYNLNRILIVDWDVHHGQGTQDLFYDDPRVLVISIHRYEHGYYWPNLRRSDYDFIGSDKGQGYNINVPLNEIGLGNGDYLAIFQRIIIPIAYEFDPQVVLVSAGYDAAVSCPEGDMVLEPSFYAHLLHSLKSFASGRICCFLEGGYCLRSLSESVGVTLRELLGDPCPVIDSTAAPHKSVLITIENVIKVLKPHWSCLKYRAAVEPSVCLQSPQTENQPVIFHDDSRTPDGGYLIDEDSDTRPEDLKKEMNRLLEISLASLKYNRTSYRTGLVFDKDMNSHCIGAKRQFHVECPERISRIYEYLVDEGISRLCHRIESRRATKSELRTIHSEQHIRFVQSLQQLDSLKLFEIEQCLDSIYLCKKSYEAASLATGSVLNMVDAVLSDVILNGIAIVRPPGHHAEQHVARGFCFFNTVAIAAEYAMNMFDLDRILIVDWDIHHGNGTQHAFFSDNRVLFVSIHRYDNACFYPESTEANYTHIGAGSGKGFNINIPWSNGRMGDTEYITAFQQIIMPVAYEFNPQLVLVSAGFDAALGDPIGQYLVNPECYGHMTHMLSSLAGGRVVLVLEGGYNLSSISQSMASCTSVLLGEPCSQIELNDINYRAADTLLSVAHIHSPYWSSLRHYDLLSAENSEDILENVSHLYLSSENGESHSKLSDSSDSSADQKSENGTCLNLSINDQDSVLSQTTADVPEICDNKQYRGDSVNKSFKQRDVNFKETEVLFEKSLTELGGLCVTTNTNDSKQVENIVSEGQITEIKSNPEEDEAIGTTQDRAHASSANGAVENGSNDEQELLQGACGGTDDASILLCRVLQGEEDLFAVLPLPYCPHLSSVRPVPSSGISVTSPCSDCAHVGENWVCLTCYTVACSRYIHCHMVQHGRQHLHSVVLSFSDISVWCYECDSYLDNQILDDAKSSARLSKFGT